MHKLPFDIIFENDELVAVNKPSGMLTLPDRHDGALQSLKGILQQQFPDIYVIHRLDKDTSGVIIFAKTEAAHRYMSMLFEGRTIEKYYAGIVLGTPEPEEGSIIEPIAEHPAKNGTMMIHAKGKPSHTDYSVVKKFKNYSLVSFRIHTGRTHQIRIHSKFIGHPLACDPLYGNGEPILLSTVKKKFKLGKNDEEERPLLNHLALHAQRIVFKNAKDETITIEAPLPKNMRVAVTQLEKYS